MDRVRFHPSEKDLLLFADGELRKGQAAKIERHLAACWGCRARLAETESAITTFVTLRRKLLDREMQNADFPSAPASRNLLRARIEDRAASSYVPVRQRIRTALWPVALTNRPLWIAGSLVVFLVARLVVEPFLTPGVSAMEVIANVRAAERQVPRGIILHQRVRIRCKQKAASSEASVDYDLWKNGVRSRILLASNRSDPADQLRVLYQTHGADWESPLSATSFARLRDSLGTVRDQVHGDEEITVTSTPVRREEQTADVEQVELTVRRSDWHAISQRIELHDAEYELTELLDETVDRGKVDPAIFAEPQVTSIASVLPAPRGTSTPAVLPLTPTRQQLDDAEIRLREAFHQTGADVEEVPEIRREGDQIHFHLFTQTTRRKEEILAALAGISFLVPKIYDAEAYATEARENDLGLPAPAGQTQPMLYSTQPPLAKALWDYSGGLEPANNYLNGVRDTYLGVLVDASALARLAERYSDPEWDRLSPESQERLNQIAGDHMAAIRNNLSNYLKLVSPVLDEMLIKRQFNVPADVETTDPGCASWRAAAPPLVADLGSLQTSFRRLFVEDRTEHPVSLSATELLRQSVRSRSRLQEELSCQP